MNFAKLFASIVTSTIWLEPPATVKLWIYFLATKDQHGIVEGSVPGLAHAAKISLEECEVALAKFLAPDLHSRTKAYQGRRIEEVRGGWRVLNHQFYRDLQVEHEYSMSPEAVKKRRQRAKGTSGDIPGHEGDVSGTGYASSSVSVPEVVVAVEENVEKRESWREMQGPAAVGVFLVQFGFTARDAQTVGGFIRGARSGYAVMAELEDHLTGEMGTNPKSPPEIVAYALQQYMAAAMTAPGQLNGALFGGFVRRARGKKAQQREEVQLAQGVTDRAEETMDELNRKAARQEAISMFEENNPARFAELRGEAERLVDPKQIRGRGVLVRAKIIELIIREIDRAS